MKNRESIIVDNTEFRKAVQRAKRLYRGCLDRDLRTVNIKQPRSKAPCGNS